MIRITIELLPLGSERHKKTLATGTIANDGTGTTGFGNYNVRLYGSKGGQAFHGKVAGHERMRKSVWHLIEKGISAAIKTE